MTSPDTELIGKTIGLPGGYDNLQVTRKIAEGGFSVVYLCKSNDKKVLKNPNLNSNFALRVDFG